MQDFFDPKEPNKSIDDNFPINYEDLTIEKEDGLFHVGQSYEDQPAKTLYCKNCNGSTFNVGKANYFTAIRCVNCGYEVCVHEG